MMPAGPRSSDVSEVYQQTIRTGSIVGVTMMIVGVTAMIVRVMTKVAVVMKRIVMAVKRATWTTVLPREGRPLD